MNDVWLIPDRLFDGARLTSKEAILLREGRIAERAGADRVPGDAARVTLPGILAPGFVDLQVNGGGGVLFNASPTPRGASEIAAAHRRFGTVAILPTLITDAPEVMAAATEAILNCHDRNGIAGIHFEGPHIAPARRGTHAVAHVRPFEEATFGHVLRLRQAGVPVMITLAPEVTGPDVVARLAATGAVVSLGHSDATSAQAKAAFAAGAGAVTHLFNAMSPLGHREPGLVGAAIASDRPVSIIADGHHVADDVVALACRARPAADLMFAVSDAMPTVGGPDSFELYGQEIWVSDGRLVNAEGNLAGAHLTMVGAVHRLAGPVGLDAETVLRMAVTTPASLLGRPDLSTLEGRSLSDLVHLAHDLHLRGVGEAILRNGETR